MIGWKPCKLHDLAFPPPGWILTLYIQIDPAQHLLRADAGYIVDGLDYLDYIDRDLYGVRNLRNLTVCTAVLA